MKKKYLIILIIIILFQFRIFAKINLSSPASGPLIKDFNGADVQGILIDTRQSKQVYSAMDGKVIFAGEFSKIQQNMIVIQSDNYKLYTIYRNVSNFKIKEGMLVKAGQSIGNSNKYLLFEVRTLDGKAQDPNDYINLSHKFHGKKKVKSDFYPKFVDFMKRNGFFHHEIPTMFCIASWESSFNRHAVNLNRNKTQDTGLFQINDIWLRKCNMTRRELFDATNNARCAKVVLRNQGFRAWVTYNKYSRFCSI